MYLALATEAAQQQSSNVGELQQDEQEAFQLYKEGDGEPSWAARVEALGEAVERVADGYAVRLAREAASAAARVRAGYSCGGTSTGGDQQQGAGHLLVGNGGRHCVRRRGGRIRSALICVRRFDRKRAPILTNLYHCSRAARSRALPMAGRLAEWTRPARRSHARQRWERLAM